jgi:hypothetical protein
VKRRLDIQKAVNAVGGVVDGCPPCPRCGGQLRVDSPGDYDPLKPEYVDWHEPWDCYEFDYNGSTIEAYLMRCVECSGLREFTKKRLTNTPTAKTMKP